MNTNRLMATLVLAMACVAATSQAQDYRHYVPHTQNYPRSSAPPRSTPAVGHTFARAIAPNPTPVGAQSTGNRSRPYSPMPQPQLTHEWLGHQPGMISHQIGSRPEYYRTDLNRRLPPRTNSRIPSHALNSFDQSALPLPSRYALAITADHSSQEPAFGHSGSISGQLPLVTQAGFDQSYERNEYRPTTDAADLAQSAPGVVNRKNSQVTTYSALGGLSGPPRVNGSGSYWVPARIDLDTSLSKIDSRLVERLNITRGPYDVHHGPGFSVIDVELVKTPRSSNGWFTHENESYLEYKTNGEQLYGRQSASGGWSRLGVPSWGWATNGQ